MKTRLVEICVGLYISVLFHFQVLDPQETALVTLGSVKNLMLEGGPLPWILDTSSYYETGNIELITRTISESVNVKYMIIL